jgi:hypothetical protein
MRRMQSGAARVHLMPMSHDTRQRVPVPPACRVIFGVLIGLCWSYALVEGQAPVTTVKADPSCTSCRIELTPLVLLGGIDDPAGFGPTAQVALSRTGAFAVSSSTFIGEIQFYSPQGTFTRTIGRKGGGPGEFNRELVLKYDRHDTLHVAERGGTRYSVFSPDLRHVRSMQLKGSILDFCIESSGTIFAIGSMVEGNTVSLGQVLARNGEPLLKFASFNLASLDPRTMPQLLACGAQGDRWTAGRATYFLDKWGPQGQNVRRLVANRDWFPTARIATGRGGAEGAAGVGSRQPQAAQLSGIALDELGRVWVFARVEDSRPRGPTTDPLKLSDTIIEIIDGNTGELLAYRRFDEPLMPLAPGRAYSVVEDNLGDRKIQVWSLRLVR